MGPLSPTSSSFTTSPYRFTFWRRMLTFPDGGECPPVKGVLVGPLEPLLELQGPLSGRGAKSPSFSPQRTERSSPLPNEAPLQTLTRGSFLTPLLKVCLLNAKIHLSSKDNVTNSKTFSFSSFRRSHQLGPSGSTGQP